MEGGSAYGLSCETPLHPGGHVFRKKRDMSQETRMRFIIQRCVNGTFDLVNTQTGEHANFTTMATIDRVAAVLNNHEVQLLCFANRRQQCSCLEGEPENWFATDACQIHINFNGYTV
jgi:hypothetical protein